MLRQSLEDLFTPSKYHSHGAKFRVYLTFTLFACYFVFTTFTKTMRFLAARIVSNGQQIHLCSVHQKNIQATNVSQIERFASSLNTP
jgi:uncharacterized membrane protein (DUF485 family)